ncbi:MAG: hypothetical protein O2936_15215, partial [Proteobacteria bacterium]|nr:hypothetical protein [Pseudomonadota bacterium]
AALPHIHAVFTVIETPVYSRKSETLSSGSEREDFAIFSPDTQLRVLWFEALLAHLRLVGLELVPAKVLA